MEATAIHNATPPTAPATAPETTEELRQRLFHSPNITAAEWNALRERDKAERKTFVFDPARNTPRRALRPRVKNWQVGGCHYCGKKLPKPYHRDGIWGVANLFCTVSCAEAFGIAAAAGGVRLVPVTA